MPKWDPNAYQRDAGFVAALGAPLIDLLAPQPHERILDLGCGDGTLTATIAALGSAVVGVDSSAEQIAAASERGFDARVMDGHALSFNADEFDAVISNAALHWMLRPDEVLACVAHVIKPRGRFVAECGGYGNVASVVDAYRLELAASGIAIEEINPWYFPRPEEYAELLSEHGFQVEFIESFERPTPIATDVRAWLEIFTQSFLETVPVEDRDALLDAVRKRLQPQLLHTNGQWVLDYVRLRFKATRRDP